MNSDNLEKLHFIYIDILKNGLNSYNINYDNDNNKSIENYITNLAHNKTYIQEMNKNLENILDVSKKLIIECDNKSKEANMQIILNDKYKNDPNKIIKIIKELNNGLSWADITEEDDISNDNINNIKLLIDTKLDNTYKNDKTLYKKLDNIYDTKLDFIYKIPIINNIKDIPSPLYWYNGDECNKEGIYMNLTNGSHIYVPFPDVLYNETKNKHKIIQCKNKTITECKKFRYNYNKNNKNYIYKCNFLHVGEKKLKYNNLLKCPFNHRFGNHLFLNNDLKNASYSDMQNFILYNISDILLLTVWSQKQKTLNNSLNEIINNIDICQ